MADRLLSSDEKGLSTAQKVKARVSTLERAAVAASTFAVIQYSKVRLPPLARNVRLIAFFPKRTTPLLL